MKKNSTSPRSRKGAARKAGPITIGMDLGDQSSRYCVLEESGEVEAEGSVATTKKAMLQKFAGLKRCRIAIEVGTHSPWVSRLLKHLGYEVIVANARQVKLISQSSRKNDRVDARTLARLVRVDPQLLSPIQHRSEQAQQHLAMIRVRAALVEARTKLVNAARGFSKGQGERLPARDAATMGVEEMTELPAGLQEVLRPLLEQVKSLTDQIQKADVETRADRPGRVPGNRTSPAGKRSRTVDRADVRVNSGRSRALPEEPRRGLLCRFASATTGIGSQPTAVADHQGRGPLSAHAAGPGSAPHFRMARTRYRFTAVGPKAGLARRQERKETCHRGGSAKTRGAPAPVVGDGRSLRALAK